MVTFDESGCKLMYDIKQLQEAFGIGKNLAYKLARKRGFPSVKINGHYYFPCERVKKWVDENTGRSIIV